MDIKGDKSLWEKMNLEGVGKVLLVEESYYGGIAEKVAELKEKVAQLDNQLKESQDTVEALLDDVERLEKLLAKERNAQDWLVKKIEELTKENKSLKENEVFWTNKFADEKQENRKNNSQTEK